MIVWIREYIDPSRAGDFNIMYDSGRLVSIERDKLPTTAIKFLKNAKVKFHTIDTLWGEEIIWEKG